MGHRRTAPRAHLAAGIDQEAAAAGRLPRWLTYAAAALLAPAIATVFGGRRSNVSIADAMIPNLVGSQWRVPPAGTQTKNHIVVMPDADTGDQTEQARRDQRSYRLETQSSAS